MGSHSSQGSVTRPFTLHISLVLLKKENTFGNAEKWKCPVYFCSQCYLISLSGRCTDSLMGIAKSLQSSGNNFLIDQQNTSHNFMKIFMHSQYYHICKIKWFILGKIFPYRHKILISVNQSNISLNQVFTGTYQMFRYIESLKL